MSNNGASIVLNYSASIYESKISSFEALNARLMTHLETLESLKGQISNFWDDDSSPTYIEAIATAITRVRAASEEINNLKALYQSTVDEQSRLSAAVDDSVSAIKDTVESSISIASGAGELAALL